MLATIIPSKQKAGVEPASAAPASGGEQAIAGGSMQAINYFVATNYMKALEGIAKSPNQKILMLPLEASSVIGSLGGLAEITKEAFCQWRSRSSGTVGPQRPPALTPGP
jgi:regulator of protease activity HflC (stomatin/prohibitin superfamily)